MSIKVLQNKKLTPDPDSNPNPDPSKKNFESGDQTESEHKKRSDPPQHN